MTARVQVPGRPHPGTDMNIQWHDRISWRGPLARKMKALAAWLAARPGGVLIAFSGGADSTFLAAMAGQVLGKRMLAVTADSPSLPRAELRQATALARRLNIRHRVIATDEMRNPAFTTNPPDRCYHCKSELFGALRRIARREGLGHIADGSNVDDQGDFRPGSRAAREHGVGHPLQDAGFTKRDIRRASRRLGLPTADKPAAACLASRFPYGSLLTAAALASVEKAESGLHRLGFTHVRVRTHGDMARVELPAKDIARAVRPRMRQAIIRRLRSCGYRYLALDLEGYRTGSLNEALPGARKAAP